MLNIHSFLQGVKAGASKLSPVKNLSADCYKTCVMITAYSLTATILVLSSDSFYGAGSSVGSSYVKAETISHAYLEAEETAQDAQIQPDEKEMQLAILENKTTKVLTDIGRTQTALGQEEQINQRIETQRMLAFQLKEQEKLARHLKEQELRKEQERLEAIASKKAKEKAAKEKAAKEKAAKEKEAKRIQLSADETQVLLRIVEAEATGEDMKGKMLVANVILNRKKSSQFPDTVSGVVFQKNGSTYQFSPIKDGRYWNVKVSKDTKTAVDRVLSGEDKSQGALFFSARSKADKSSMSWFDNHLTWLFQYGGHEFYK